MDYIISGSQKDRFSYSSLAIKMHKSPLELSNEVRSISFKVQMEFLVFRFRNSFGLSNSSQKAVDFLLAKQ